MRRLEWFLLTVVGVFLSLDVDGLATAELNNVFEEESKNLTKNGFISELYENESDSTVGLSSPTENSLFVKLDQSERASNSSVLTVNQSGTPSTISSSTEQTSSTTYRSISEQSESPISTVQPLNSTNQNTTENNGRPNRVKYFLVPNGSSNDHIQTVVNNATNEAIEELMNKISGNGNRTQIYIFAIVGILPAAGAMAWCIKWMLVKYKKNGQESEDFHSVQESSGPAYVKAPESCLAIPAPKLIAINRRTNSFKEYDGKYYGQTWQPPPIQNVTSPVNPWEFPRNRLLLTEIIGEGNFGQVWKAEARHLSHVPGVMIVAVKTVKGNASVKERQELLKELQIMQKLGRHPNVVTLLGSCTLQEPYYLIMEFVLRGKLLSFLRGHRSNRNYYNCHPTSHSLTSRDLTLFAYQIVLGMEYIASKGIIHRDLAARNILVDHMQVCKVADFGLARCVKDNQYEVYEQKSKGALPIRWMAPESLYMDVFTAKSDVWALGVLLWEIVTLGSTPYPGMGPREVVHYVREGNAMERPHHCRLELYRVMKSCWAPDPKERPTFVSLKKELARLLELQTGYIDLEHFPENCYYNLYQSPGERV